MKVVPTRMQGFTLVELALVMLILGLLTGGLVSSFSAVREAREQAATRKAMVEIERAVLGYAVRHQGALPSADRDGDGMADAGVTRGGVPWATLALDARFQQDAWQRDFRYHVDAGFISPLSPTPQTRSGLQVEALYTTAAGAPGRRVLTAADPQAPVLVLVSYGVNGRPGAETACSGNANGDGDGHYLTGINASCRQLDDLVFWLSPYRLFDRLVVAGVWP